VCLFEGARPIFWVRRQPESMVLETCYVELSQRDLSAQFLMVRPRETRGIHAAVSSVINYRLRRLIILPVRCDRALAQLDRLVGPGITMSGKPRSVFGLEWMMGAGIVLVAIAMIAQAYFFTGDRLSTTSEAISRLW
jgi:hypothetical protein